MVSNITPDIVDSPPSKPSPTPRLTTCRTLRRSHDAVAMYSVSIANRKQASIFDTNVPTTNGEPFTDGSSRSVARRNPTPTKPPTNTTRYIRPSARGLNRACMRFIGASGICGGCLDAAAPDGRTSARATSATSIAVWRDSAHHPRLASLPPVVLAIPSRSPCTWLSADSVVPPQPYGNELAAGAVFLTLYESTRALQPNIEHVRFGG